MKFIKGVAKALVGLVLLVSMVPYLLPINAGSWNKENKPFLNSFYFDAGDLFIHYRIWNPKDIVKGKILMVHGMAGSTYSFEKTAVVMAEHGYLVVAADLPGFGYSSRGVDINHSNSFRASKLWELLDQIDSSISDHKWILLGHSMGAATVATMTLDRPQETNSLILVAGAIGSNRRNSNILFKFPPVLRWTKALVNMFALKPSRIESLLISAYAQQPSKEDVKGYLEPLLLPGTTDTIEAIIKTSDGFDLSRVSDIKSPILAIWGSEDSWVPLSIGKELIKVNSKAKLEIINGAGHCPMETHPAEFNSILLSFIKDQNN